MKELDQIVFMKGVLCFKNRAPLFDKRAFQHNPEGQVKVESP